MHDEERSDRLMFCLGKLDTTEENLGGAEDQVVESMQRQPWNSSPISALSSHSINPASCSLASSMSNMLLIWVLKKKKNPRSRGSLGF